MAQILIFHQNSNYGTPSPAGFDYNDPTTSPVINNPYSDEYNVDYIVKLALNRTMEYTAAYRTKHVMWTMGEDNRYAFADLWYKNMDKLIFEVNRKSSTHGVHFLYSSPDCYTKSKHEANLTWTTNSYDYLPLRILTQS